MVKLYIFIGATVIWLIGSYVLNNNYSELQNEFNAKSEKISKFRKLDEQWDKKAQKNELSRVDNILNVQGVKFKVKKRKTKKTYSMNLNYHQINPIINYVLSRNINIKKFTVKKIDAHNAEFNFEVDS